MLLSIYNYYIIVIVIVTDRPSPARLMRGTRSTAEFVPSSTYPDALDLTVSEGQVPVS